MATTLAGPKVVALGGGHGLAASLSALREVAGRLTAVVTVADDGGSSGRLRDELGVLPPGDLRMALAALCGDDEWGRTWAQVLQHRFSSGGELDNHAAGNLLIAALWELLGETVAGLDWVGRLLGARGRVLPMSLEALRISAVVHGPRPGGDGISTDHVVVGQHEIATSPGQVRSVSLIPSEPAACTEAVEAILDADWVVLGPGSWFTSVIPHLLVPDLRRALETTTARRAVVLNLATDDAETSGFSPQEQLRVLASYAPALCLDLVLADAASVPDQEGLRAVTEEAGGALVVSALAAPGQVGVHDPARLALAFADTLGRGRIAAWR